MPHTPTIVTTRLLLCPATESDLDSLRLLWDDPLIRLHLWHGRDASALAALGTLRTCLAYGETSGLGLTLIRARDASLAGFFAFWPRADARKPDLMLGLLPGFRGQGLATEAATALLHHAFHHGLADECVCSVSATNLAAQKLLLRLGMRFQAESALPEMNILFYRLLQRWLGQPPRAAAHPGPSLATQPASAGSGASPRP